MEKLEVFLTQLISTKWDEFINSSEFHGLKERSPIEIDMSILTQKLADKQNAIINEFKFILLEIFKDKIADPFDNFANILSKYVPQIIALPKLPKIGSGSMFHPYRLLYLAFMDIIDELKLEQAKHDQNLKGCDCQLRATFQMNPVTELETIGKGNDGYYDFDAYQCKKCKIKWICTDTSDGMSSSYQWKIWDEKKYPII